VRQKKDEKQWSRTSGSYTKSDFINQWGAFYLFIADFFATQIIGGAKELVVLL
jgi:hypothetical protein